MPNVKSKISNKKYRIAKLGLKRGFTLIELLVVFAILFIGSTLSIASFRRFGDARILDVAAAEVESFLNYARVNAVTQTIPEASVCTPPKKWRKYSVKILDTDTYEMDAYCDNDITIIKTKDLPSEVTFIVLPSPNNEISFQIGTGTLTPSAVRTITLNGAYGAKTISIDTAGNITKP